MSFITRYRIAITFVIALVIIAATAVRRGPSDPDLPNLSQFWANKMSWRGAADCVVAGDSSAGQGIVPATLSEQLGGARVLNFAFDSGGYSEEYLLAIDEVLDHSSPSPIILLALTPYSLTPGAIRLNEFEHQRHLAASPLTVAFADSLDRLQPMQVDRVGQELAGRRTKGPARDRIWHADGWVQVKRGAGNERMYARHYHESFVDNKVSADVVRNVARHVADWSRKGVRVAVFRAPAASPIRAIENACSGFDEALIQRLLENAGAQWLEPGGQPYVTYDGRHLGAREAMRLTADLGMRIALNQRSEPGQTVVYPVAGASAQKSHVRAAMLAD